MTDVKKNLKFQDMVKSVTDKEGFCICSYQPDYIVGETVQYQIARGIWALYHNLELKDHELYLPEEKGLIRINYCFSGRCELDYQPNRVFYVGPGDLGVAFLGNREHRHCFPLGIYRGISIFMTVKALDDFLSYHFGSSTSVDSIGLKEKIEKLGNYGFIENDLLIQGIMQELVSIDEPLFREKAVIKFAELILLLSERDWELDPKQKKYFDKTLIDKVKRIKREITVSPDLYMTVEEIGKYYQLSMRAFSDCFKAIYGKTYYAYIKEFRIKKAASMLCDTKKNISDIAMVVGYQNASKFSKAFMDVMGVNPVSYRRSCGVMSGH